MNKRLFAVGCSFTRYHWPTYADIIGKNFDEFQNWGNSGLGNRAILERLTEISIYENLNKNDIVLVQWSDPHRFDLHLPHRLIEDGWFTGGSIHNNPHFTEEWKLDYWNEFSYVMHTLNFISLATVMLDKVGCKYIMTSMNSIVDDINKFVELDEYRKIIETDNWTPPMKAFFENSNYDNKKFKKSIYEYGILKKQVDIFDPHPTPLAHCQYADTFLKNKLDLNLDKQWAEAADSLLDTITDHRDIRDLYIKKLDWDNKKSWKKGL
jgi:hypothetical protein